MSKVELLILIQEINTYGKKLNKKIFNAIVFVCKTYDRREKRIEMKGRAVLKNKLLSKKLCKKHNCFVPNVLFCFCFT